jgi:ribosomal-protein-alanine N-acetyltransferase
MESMQLTIHKLRREDVPAVSLIESQVFSMPWLAEDFAALVEAENNLYLVAEADGVIVACCGVTNVAGEGNINNVAVAEGYRRKGIAEALMTELLHRARLMGMEDFTLEVRMSNTAAIRLYEKLGFLREGIRPGFYEKPKEDAIIMWKYSLGNNYHGHG